MVRSLSRTTFDRSAHRAPHWSFKFRACLCGQSAVISPVEELGVDAIAHNQSINPILARASALVTSDAQHRQFADDVAECDRAFARHQIIGRVTPVPPLIKSEIKAPRAVSTSSLSAKDCQKSLRRFQLAIVELR